MSWLAVLLAVLTAAATATGYVCTTRTQPRHETSTFARKPLPWLVVVLALIYLNQLLVNVYVLRVHNGDPSFITRYLPSGWFAMAQHSWLVEHLAAMFPAPGLLSLTVLRVQAFLELPFVLLVCLTVTSWLGAAVHGRALRLVPAAAVADTVTFCLIEWSLHNPFTVQDIIIRLVSAVLITPLAGRLSTPESLPLLPFVVSLGCLGYLVLIVYDTALVYNLAHLGPKLPKVAAACALLIVARFARPREGPALGTVRGALGWFLVLFLVPALSLRYSLDLGFPAVAVVVVIAVLVASAWFGVRETPNSPVRALAVAVGAGLLAGAIGFAAIGGYLENRVLTSACAFFLVLVLACTLIDRRIGVPSKHGR